MRREKISMATKSESGKLNEEREFLASYDVSKFERPSVAVDVSLLAVRDGKLVTWLVRRKEHPQRGRWALPGGFVRMRESLQDAALRVLADKSGVSNVFVEQLFTFGALDRDPRTRVIAVAYYALIDVKRLEPLAAERGEDVCVANLHVPWAEETGGPVEAAVNGKSIKLAFDHAEQLGLAVKRLRGKLVYAPIGFQLLPEQFTLRELQLIHEAVLERSLNKDSFRRKMLASGELEATGEYQSDVDHRPAEMYRFSKSSAI
jgi:8-oxo-dGTP diphosphatase